MKGLKKLLTPSTKMRVKEQLRYIDDLAKKNPNYKNDDYLRTYLHYQCKLGNLDVYKKIIINLAAFILLPIITVLYFINGKKKIRIDEQNCVFINANNKYGMAYDYSDKFPFEIIAEKYGNVYFYEIKKYPDIKKGMLDLDGFKAWMKLVSRYPFCPYMNLTCLLYLGLICKIIRSYRPSVIINAKVETNYTSSFITGVCESKGISYNLIMHGDLFLDRSMAFVRFSKIYVWDNYYKKMFSRLYVGSREYIIFTPKMFTTQISERNPYNYITYYMTGTGDGDYVENVEGIIDILKIFAKQGKHVSVRPHPRWSDIGKIKSLCHGNNITVEDYKKISVVDSLNATKYVMGSFSTVLAQGFYAGKKIIIDNVTNDEGFQEIKDADYILLSKEHQLLSDFLRL